MIDFGREWCRDPALSGSHEWLVTNGLGGYASGTVAGVLTRGYHGLLIAALQPPVERTLLLTNLEETATYRGRDYVLFANCWGPGEVEPQGFLHLESFRLEGTTPVWTYACDDARLVKRVWMEHGANTTYVRYDLASGSGPLALQIRAIVNHRDHHARTRAGDWLLRAEPVAHGLRLSAGDHPTSLFLLSDRATAQPRAEWVEDYYLGVEAYRGEAARDDNLYAGLFQAVLAPGGSLTLVAGTAADPDLDGIVAYARQRANEARLLDMARPHLAMVGSHPAVPIPAVEHLVLAAGQFIVGRPLPGDAPGDTSGRSIIAGYPWFSDWGRDTMISLPGLALVTGRHEIAARLLRTFARFVDRGMLPNRFPDEGQAPEYNTADATLWYFEAIRAYHEATGDEELLRELFPVLQEIVDWHRLGTRYRIRVDPADNLLYAGEEGVQLTWMDAKVDGWVVTPRIGKPVEINALWYHALCCLAGFARRLGQPDAGYEAMAADVQAGFDRFWNPAAGYCYDVLDGPAGDDPALRPNQLLAVSLPHSPLDGERQRAVVDACARALLPPHGLRSLAPDHADYVGSYGGDRRRRDAAYHQGTVWGWLIGPFVRAHLRVYGDPARARSFLHPLLGHLAAHGLGSISEIFDGDAPFAPRGCIAQAWSVAELLACWQATEAPGIGAPGRQAAGSG